MIWLLWILMLAFIAFTPVWKFYLIKNMTLYALYLGFDGNREIDVKLIEAWAQSTYVFIWFIFLFGMAFLVTKTVKKLTGEENGPREPFV